MTRGKLVYLGLSLLRVLLSKPRSLLNEVHQEKRNKFIKET